MKKILSFALALAMCVICFAGCSQIADDDATGKGAIIDMYVGTKVYDLDPAISYTDESVAKILSLVFEGLSKIDENGKWQKALMRDYELEEIEMDDGSKRWEMQVRINTTYWSDGSLVQTNDIIYAWKRILDPTFDSPAAAMLFAIDGAYERKNGAISEDDIGIYSTAKDKMTIQFEENVTKEMIDEFLYNTASLALVPVRETKVKTYPDTWSKKSSDLSTNGPFKVKKFTGTPGEEIVLERSAYYYLSQETDNEAIDKYVTPYRLVFHYAEPLDKAVVYSTKSTDIIGMLADKKLFYAGNLHGEVLKNFKASDIKYNEVASTYSYYFNTSSEIGSNATVRYALSIAIDRAAIAEELNNGSEAATGLIAPMVFDTKKGTSFRKEGKDILPSAANKAEAERLLEEANIIPDDFDTIYLYYIKDVVNDSYQSSEWGYESKEKLAATYAKKAWEELGFKVVIKGVTAEEHAEIYANGKYDVIGLDYQMVSAYALANLTPFAKAYSGRVLEEDKGERLEYTKLAHISGYYNADYDALIETALNATTQKDRAAALHEAEELLLNDAPVIPVIFNSEVYVSSALSDITTNFWGCNLFTKTYLNNYVDHNTATDEGAATTEAGSK